MLELGQLERRHEEFAKRNTRVVAVTLEGREDAARSQADFPHLIVLSDEGRGLATAAGVVHPASAPDGGDTAAPTTILVDRTGTVRWLFRPDAAITRLSPEDVLAALDAHQR